MRKPYERSLILKTILPLCLALSLLCTALLWGFSNAASALAKTGIEYDDVTWSATAENPFGVAQYLNGIILGNAENIIDVEGALAVQGNLTSTRGISTGFGRLGATTDIDLTEKDVRLLVGGNVSLGGYLSVYGHAMVGGTVTATGVGYSAGLAGNVSAQIAALQQLYAINSDSDVSQSGNTIAITSWGGGTVWMSPERAGADLNTFFTSAKTSLVSMQTTLKNMTVNGTTTEGDDAYVLAGTASDTNVFNLVLSGASTDTKNVTVNIPSGSVAVVNVYTDDDVTINNYDWATEAQAGNIIYNFINAKNITFDHSITMFGSVLAPEATLNVKASGNINGVVALGGLKVASQSGFEFHNFPFTGFKVPVQPETHRGKILVYKDGESFSSVTESNGVYTPVYTTKGQSGAAFNVIANADIFSDTGTLLVPKETLVDVIVTGADGYGMSSDLYYGSYRIEERTAPTGFVRSKTVKYATVSSSAVPTTAMASFTNDRQKLSLDIDKTMQSDSLFKVGGSDALQDVVFGLYAAENITAADGTYIPKDGLIESIHVDAAGHGVFTADVPIGNYYVKEIATNEKYVLDTTKYDVPFEYGGQELATVSWTVNKKNVVENKLKRGSVVGHKIDGNGADLSGAKIGLFPQGTTEFTLANAYMADTSTATGYFSFEQIPYGTYVVHEIEAPTGYVLSDVSYPVVIDADKKVINIEINNLGITGNVKLTKVDAEDSTKKISGATYEVYADVNANGTYDKDTDVLYGTLTEGATGVYSKTALPYGGYFVHETAVSDGYKVDGGYYYFNIDRNGETEVIETTVGNNFQEQRQKGALKIVKTSDDKVVAGLSFRVTGTTAIGTQYSQVFVTDANGLIQINDLPVGTYTASEVSNEANAAYILPPDQTVVINEDVTAQLEFHNTVNKGSFEIKKIDADTGRAVAACGFAIYDSKGTKVVEGYTDAYGILTFTLPMGSYTCAEISAPDGYSVNTTQYSFELQEYGQIVSMVIENQPNNPPTPPITFDSSSFWYWFVIFVVMSGLTTLTVTAITVTSLKKKHGDNSDDNDKGERIV